jgi:hypothetical protein
MKSNSSVQILVTNPTNQLLQLPLYGHFRARMFAIFYHATATTVQYVQIRSGQMKFKYPAVNGTIQSLQYPTIISRTDNQIPSLSDSIEFEMVLNGNLEINIVDLVTGAAPATFQSLIFTLNLERLDGMGFE